jgi:putative ABC transport system permease protein
VRWHQKLILRVRSLFRKGAVDSELDSELEFHIDMQTRENIAKGMRSDEARYAARRLFGSVDQMKEECRDERRVNLIETFGADIRHGVRLLAKQPGFTVTAIATLVLGIGTCTAIFSVVNAALLRPLPFADPDRVVLVWETRVKNNANAIPAAPGNFADWRVQAQAFQALAATADTEINMISQGEPERVRAQYVSANFFDLLGIRPRLGRGFRADEDLPGASPVVILTDSLWKQRFGADAGVIGKAITLDADRYIIIGVLPPSSYVGYEQLYLPFVLPPNHKEDRYAHWLKVVGRIGPGYTLERAQTEMDMLARRMEKDHPQTNTGWGIRLVRFHEQMAGALRPALLLLLGAVSLVLAIACANVSNLLLARSVPRQREMAIRTALGANRRRLIRQFLTETLLLCVAGAALGLALARWGLDALRASLPQQIMDRLPYLKSIPIDARVLGFTILMCVLAMLACSLAPAFYASRRDPQTLLQSGSRGSSIGRAGGRLRSALVVAEVALSVVLLVGSGLALRSLMHVLEVRPGFNPRNLLTMHLALSPTNHKEPRQAIAFHNELQRKLKSVPGVLDVSTITVLPLSGRSYPTAFAIADRNMPAWKAPTTECLAIGKDYFAAMGVPISSGRSFTGADNERSPKVAVINETLRNTFFPSENPIGKKIIVWRESTDPREIVGVVADVRNAGLDLPPGPDVFVPFAQDPQLEMSLVVRAAVEPTGLIAGTRRVIHSLDPDTPVDEVMTMDTVIAASPTLVWRRVPSILMAVLAVTALILASVGIGGVMSSTVGQRTQEIGIRMALGAHMRDVLAIALGQSIQLLVIGLCIGLPISFALTRLLAQWLFEVTPLDAVTYASVALILIVVALAASYVPARRAAQVDPTTALRYE